MRLKATPRQTPASQASKPTLTTFPTPEATRLLAFKVVKTMVPASRTWFWREITAGRFPRPVRLSTNRVAFVESEILAWIQARDRA
jgi:prophage regulatory protein